MKAINTFNSISKALAAGIILSWVMVPHAYADIYINVMAVNGANSPKDYSIKFDLPGELTAEDILDTNGLDLDYSVDDGDYFVFGSVSLKPKESKTFRIHVKDKWMVTQDEANGLKKQIDQGYQTLGKPYDQPKADILKDRLEKKIDYILSLQGTNGESIDKRIDDYRAYSKEMKRIQNDALNRDYWRSNPADIRPPKLIHLTIEVSNPTKVLKHFKHKDFLPAEVKPEDVVEPEDFEVRFDQIKQLAFLFKDEDLSPGQSKKYTIGMLDIWSIDQANIDNLRSRAQYVDGFLKDTRFAKDVGILMDRITGHLKEIEASQAVDRPILEHINAYRINKATYDDTLKDVENLEKILSVFREDLEKSKVENVLQKMQSLKNMKDVSNVLFNKKFESSEAWKLIGWILLIAGGMTVAGYVVALVRSKDKKIDNETPPQG